MFENKLEQIDRALIELLNRRISILAEQQSELDFFSKPYLLKTTKV